MQDRDHNIAFALLRALEDNPEKPAILCGEQSLTSRALAAAIMARAEIFRKSGVTAGERCLIFSGRGVAFWVDFIALWTIGAVAVPVEPTVAPDHASEILRCAAPRFASGRPEDVPEVLKDLPELAEVDLERTEMPREPWQDLVTPVQQPDLAAILFTSGTTGLPKGVRVRHEMLLQNALGTRPVLDLRPSDRLLFAIPFRFISSISHTLVALLSQATLVCTEDPLLPGALVALVRDCHITAFGGAPLQLHFVSQADREVLPHLRWVMSSGDHLPVAVIERLRAKFPGLRINTVYGLTELAGRFCALPPDDIEGRAGSVGRPIPGLTLKVLDDQGIACPPGEIGHVYAEGVPCFDGYMENEPATREALTPEGYKTGDLGYLDKEGYLFLSGRSDSVFKRSGLKLSTLPIADALMATELFADVAVVPKADEVQGHVPVVYYVLKPASEFDRGAVQAALRKSLPVNSLPAAYHAIKKLPRTGSGKIDRRKLAALISELESPTINAE
jgi:acyl-coenzyme A synthetase/AMP-(fatty) acid ligase